MLEESHKGFYVRVCMCVCDSTLKLQLQEARRRSLPSRLAAGSLACLGGRDINEVSPWTECSLLCTRKWRAYDTLVAHPECTTPTGGSRLSSADLCTSPWGDMEAPCAKGTPLRPR